jgi:type II secretory pathway component PulJ
MSFHLLKTRSQFGFTVLEALFASAVLALGLFGSFQLSLASMSANQSQRNLDLASGLAQDLAECWQVPSAFCTAQFQNLQNTGALSTEAGIQFERRWNTTAISTQGSDSNLLQILNISVKWPNPDNLTGNTELRWQIRRASTPHWVGL